MERLIAFCLKMLQSQNMFRRESRKQPKGSERGSIPLWKPLFVSKRALCTPLRESIVVTKNLILS